jgi:preprotein translocase SecE subunit
VQGVQRYIVFTFLGLSVLLWVTLSKFAAALAYAANVSDTPVIGSQFTLSTLIGLVIAAGSGFVAYKNEKANAFAAEVIGELKKVTWPAKKEVQTATVVVIVTTIILGVTLFVFDTAWGQLTGIIYKN